MKLVVTSAKFPEDAKDSKTLVMVGGFALPHGLEVNPAKSHLNQAISQEDRMAWGIHYLRWCKSVHAV